MVSGGNISVATLPSVIELMPGFWRAVGPWLPPERTFAAMDGQDLRVERARFFDVGVTHDFAGAYIERDVEQSLARAIGRLNAAKREQVHASSTPR